MAARAAAATAAAAAAVAVLLLAGGSFILFTEAAVNSAGLRGDNGSGAKKSSRSTNGAGLNVEIRPRGAELVVGRSGLTLTCSGAGPLAEVTWLYNDEPEPLCQPPARCSLQRNGALRLHKKKNLKEQKRKGREGNGTVSIEGIQRNEYRCVARTSHGALRSAPTNILYAELAHIFSESPEDLTVQEGEVSRLSCSIDSIPFPPNITWLHNGEILPTDHNKTKYAFIPPGVLYIKATKTSDAGSYRCVTTNTFLNMTKKSKEAKLTVIPRHENEESSSRVSLFPQASYNHSLKRNTNLLLACAASGYPTPFTSWTFIPHHADGEKVLHHALRNSSSGLTVLELKNVNTSDAGIYICTVKNSMDNSTNSQNITVNVLIPPSFIKKPANQVCPNGRTARFECQAQGFPTPRIYWLRNSQNITINGRRTTYTKEFNKMELAISATVPADSGIYQCVAVNSAGEIWAAGRLQVNASRNSPATPTSLVCEARSPVKMFISWEPPKFLPSSNITAYTVHYRPVDGGKEEVSPEPGNSTSVEVTKHLEPFTNYTFYVRLWNNHGPSDQSANITCSTTESVPKTAPKISVNVMSSTKLNITWKPLARREAQGIVTEYKLEWRVFQHPSVRVLSLSADINHYVLSDLIPGEQYDLRILARTKQGWPNVSESQLGWVTITMPPSNELTHAQILILNSTTIKIKWNLRANSILQFTSWRIYCKNDYGITIVSVNLTKNSTEYILSNLEPNTSYSIELCALNFTKVVHCVTKRADLREILLSNNPTVLEAIPVSSSSISLTWSSGKLSESNSFEVCYHAVHFLNESSTCTTINSTRIIIDNLKPFMLYQFKVTALSNDTNEKLFSETIECYTNEDIPGKVEDIEYFVKNSTVRIAWKEPNSINGVIQNYFVAYSTDRSEPRSTWSNITVFGNKTYTSLPGLVPGKQYFVVIQAATKAGFGSPSEPIVIVTGSSSAEAPSSLDEYKPLPKIREDKKLGIILGIGISSCCIIVCLCSMYCRKKYESLRSLRESAQPFKSRVLTRNGNSCCVDRSSTPISQPPVSSNEFELAVLCPSTPISTNPLCDSKGGHANGIIESCAKEPLLTPWEMNGINKDLRITENPQYKPKVNEDSKSSQQQSHVSDMNSTQLTMINCDLSGSNESLNNNMGCRTVADQGNGVLPQKTALAIVPVLEPNG